jgi:hypothetical protein
VCEREKYKRKETKEGKSQRGLPSHVKAAGSRIKS